MRAVIFAHGDLTSPQATLEALLPDDFIIAADGGAKHCSKLGITPDLVIGDFDSLTKDELEKLQNAGAQIIRHPASKDETDLELAFRQAQQMGIEEVLVFGALGFRWDMSIANLLLLAHSDFQHLRITCLNGPQILKLLSSGKKLEVQGQPGDTVSLIPIGGDSRGITTHGLEYSLKRGTLRLGTTRGISNVLQNNRASIELEDGLLLVVLIHRNPNDTHK
ncbi:MAG: thiamine diphosphokinase [Chloroflexota bacterium]